MQLNEATGATHLHCHLCEKATLNLISGYERLFRVSSDCHPVDRGGQLGVCETCGTVQKPVDARWNAEVRKIYESYSIYHQAAGAEQAVFDADSGQGTSRSRHLFERVRAEIPLPRSGRLLDVGCGNGAFLAAFSQLEPDWSLAGTELSAKYRDVVEAIRGVEALHTCPPGDVPGHFDFISLMHVLEHIPEPESLLRELRRKLTPNGVLLIEVPNHVDNPFDLLVADHSTHFSAQTLSALATRSGFEVLSVASDWVPKEITLLARDTEFREERVLFTTASVAAARARVSWLEVTFQQAKALTPNQPFGIFGTSIAGAWFASELDGAIAFFVDEDRNRVAREYFGRPVYRPENAPPGSTVFIALVPPIAEAIAPRLRELMPTSHLAMPRPLPAE